ncbi:restriction endonuclease subunit S [Clostridium sp.]|uniref:restriction endonuclease subunit S n=1 Tax=Clostridium sp. TaxID=1506 RepID=UPI002FC915D9
MSFKSYKLGEIYSFSSGLSKSRDEFGFGYPFVTFKDVFYNYFIPEQLTELANTTEKERQNCSVKRGDVFLTRTSETLHELGQSAVALKDYPNAAFNGFSKRLRPNNNVEIHPEYIGYYFRSPRFRAEITSMAVMTTRASLNNEIMSRLKVEIPPIEEQKAIAKILSDLDNKIEVNNKINQRLEDMAQSIFKHWFVDFEFPDDEGKSYKSSGGEMVESELGMIPKGWEVVRFGEISTVASGKRPKNKSKEKTDECFIPLIGASSIMGYVNDVLYDEQILIIGRVGTHGVVQRVYYKSWPSDNTLVIKSKFYEYIYQILNLIDYKGLNVGSTQPLITQTDIKNIEVLLPTNENLNRFELVVGSLFNNIKKNNIENEKLSNLRDTLLSKLMSGEIRVGIDKIND